MEKMIKQLEEYGIVPVVVLDNEEDAVPLAKALMEGGLPLAEVTFRTEAAAASIRKMSEAYPEMLIGAGTVLSVSQVKEAVEAGAKFIVSPGFDEEVVGYCLANQIPVFPGCITPTEVTKAVKRGLQIVKFFPAEQAGGLPMIKAMAAPFGKVKFMPTGGIHEKNLASYLECEKVCAVGGSFMVKSDMIKAHRFDEIKEQTKQAVTIVKTVRG